jgi:hypothetical protein
LVSLNRMRSKLFYIVVVVDAIVVVVERSGSYLYIMCTLQFITNMPYNKLFLLLNCSEKINDSASPLPYAPLLQLQVYVSTKINRHECLFCISLREIYKINERMISLSLLSSPFLYIFRHSFLFFPSNLSFNMFILVFRYNNYNKSTFLIIFIELFSPRAFKRN